MCFYLHLTGYRPGMIDPHPVVRIVIVGLNVAGGPLELGAQFVLAVARFGKKSAYVIGFSRDGLATGPSYSLAGSYKIASCWLARPRLRLQGVGCELRRQPV
jgi:hypothetical protein